MKLVKLYKKCKHKELIQLYKYNIIEIIFRRLEHKGLNEFGRYLGNVDCNSKSICSSIAS
jgi:hypothetical protein